MKSNKSKPAGLDTLTASLPDLVKERRPRVVEVLQLYGDFPDCTEENAGPEDWNFVLQERIGDLAEHLRFDASDPVVIGDIRSSLANIIATCEAWDRQLLGIETAREKRERGYDTHAAATAAMNSLPEVTWDRFCGEMESEQGIEIYGWIPRDDGRFDFIVLRVDNHRAWSFITSSAKYTGIFAERLFGQKGCSHADCMRVETFFSSVNACKGAIHI